MLEILSIILDYVSATDLIRCARVSKRLREMVYDDTRWVRKLQAMGCWDETAARARGNVGRSRKPDLHQEAAALKARNTHGSTRTESARGRKPSALAPQSQEVAETQSLGPKSAGHRDQTDLIDGFDYISLSPTTEDQTSPIRHMDNESLLQALNHVRSIRGAARGEFGRVYAALRPYYTDAVKSKHPSNAKVFRVYRDPDQQAQMLSQLLRFAKSDSTPGQMRREKRLSSMVAAFEDAVAREYEQGLRIGDVDGRMRKYAHVLVTLNGGQRAIDRFLSENTLLRDGPQLGDPMDCFSPSNPELLFLEESRGFFGHLSAICNSQIAIVERVFPSSVHVIPQLLQRVGIEIILPYLNKIFIHAQNSTMESHVRAVPGTYEQMLQFAASLRSSSAEEQMRLDMVAIVTEKLFSTYLDKYLQDELDLFRRRSEAEVTGWERQLSQQDASIESLYMSNVNRQADKRDFLSSFKKVVMAPVNALPAFPFGTKGTNGRGPTDSPDGPSTEPPSRSSTPLPEKASKHMASARAPSPFAAEAPSTELAAKAAIMKSRLEGIKTLFSLEVALSLVHMAKASIDRAAVFANVEGRFRTEARAQCEAIFILLLKTLGNRHVRAGFDQAVEHLSKYNPRTANDREEQPGVTPLVVFLELVNVGDLIQQMLDVFYEQELVAKKLTDRNDFLNPTIKEKKRFEQMLDERVAAGLNKGIEVLMIEVEFLCATTQTVEDFNPGATGVAINNLVDVSPTNTAIWVVEVVSAHTRMLVGSTDKNMLDVFNQEVGLRLFNALCKHLKRQRISVSGSIRLIRYKSYFFTDLDQGLTFRCQ